MNDFARPRARPDDRTRDRTAAPTGRGDVFDSVTERVTDVVDALGYLGVAFLVTIENRRMPIGQFTVYTAIGSAVWNSALVGGGYALGDRWEEVGDYVGYLQCVVIVAVVVLAARYAWTKFVGNRPGDDEQQPPVRLQLPSDQSSEPARLRRDDASSVTRPR